MTVEHFRIGDVRIATFIFLDIIIKSWMMKKSLEINIYTYVRLSYGRFIIHKGIFLIF